MECSGDGAWQVAFIDYYNQWCYRERLIFVVGESGEEVGIL